MKKRDANIELLRIVSMILIVAGHFVGQNNVIEILDGNSLFVSLLLGSACRIAVNIFLIIGIWFMVDREFCARRILVLYGEVWFYGAVLSFLMVFKGEEVTILSIMRAIFPFSLRGLWFVSNYIALMLLSPFLKLVIDKFNRDFLGKFVLLLFYFMCVMSFLNKPQDHWIDNLAWFSFMYLAVGGYKKYCNKRLNYNFKMVGLAGVALYTVMIIILFVTCKREESVLAQYIYNFVYSWILDIKSLPNFLCAVSMFYFFKNINIKHGIELINICSRHALAVYIIHQTGTFIRFMWDKIFRCAEWIESSYFILFYILTVLIIYFACMPIDWLRRKYVETIFIKSRLFKMAENKIDSFYQSR